MGLIFPPWYEGGWPSAEVTAKGMLDPYLGQCDPAPKVFSWLPGVSADNPNGWAEYLPFVLLMRTGTTRPDELIDFARVDVAAFADTRTVSEQLSEFVRQVLLAHCGGVIVDTDDGKAHVTGVHVFAGQDVRPQSAFDKRATFATYEIGLRKPLGTPDYQAMRELGQMS